MLDRTVRGCLVLQDTGKPSCNVAAPFCVPTSNGSEFLLRPSRRPLVLSVLWVLVILTGVWTHLTVVEDLTVKPQFTISHIHKLQVAHSDSCPVFRRDF